MITAAIGDTGYNIVLLLHILTAFAAFAPMFVHPLLGKGMATANLNDRASVFGLMVQNGTKIYATALIVSGLLGFGVAGMSDKVYKMSQGWLIVAFIVWVAMNGVLHAMILKSEKAIASAGTAGDAAAEKKSEMGGVIITVLFVVQIFVMVFKPGL